MCMPGEAPRSRMKGQRFAFLTAAARLRIAALAMASFQAVLYAHAEVESTPAELEAARKLNLPVTTNENPICKAPKVLAAAKKVEAGIAAIDKAIDEIRDNAFRGGRDTLAAEEREQTGALENLRRKLQASLKTLEALPSCESLLAAYAARQALYGNGPEAALHLIETAHGPIRGGASVSYPMQPWGAKIVVAPVLSADWLDEGVRRVLPGGGVARIAANAAATAGVKIGPRITPEVWTYAIAGGSLVNESAAAGWLKQSSTLPGATAGAGFAFSPRLLQAPAQPYSVFAEYRHTWLSNAPLAAPGVAFRRDEDAMKIGVGVPLGFAPPPLKLAVE